MVTMRAYILGFLLSAACTLVAFALAAWHLASSHTFPTHEWLVPALITLAVMQLVVQLTCFLHLGKHSPTRTLLAAIFAAIIVALVVGGTLWIMAHLEHNMGQTPFDGSPTPQHQHGG